MKQYKSIVKDYTSGKEYVDIKHKPDLPICGYANVYLYNVQTGKLELEAHTPNIIYPEVYQWLRSYQWRKFAENTFNNSITDIGYWEMNNIYLTTSDRPETERVNIWNYDYRDVSGANPGKMIGWANKSTYQGTDTQRGTPNTAESYANNSRIHWVFDWPTNAGNGTFQSIIWGNQLVPYIGNIFNISTGINTGTGASGFGLTYADGYLYAISYDGKLYKLTTDGILSGSVISTGINTGTGASGFGLTYADGYLYAISYGGKLYKLTTDGILLGSAISTGINTGTGASGFGLTYANGYLYAISYDGKLYKLTTDGILLGSAISTGINTGTGYSDFGLTYANGYLYAISYDGKLYKLTTDGILLGSAISTGINTGADAGFGLTYANGYLYAISYGGKLYTINDSSDHFLARTLLAAPVTKTNQQTMKIQYDFIYGE